MDLDEPNKLYNSDFTDVNVLNDPAAMTKVVDDGVLKSYRVELTTKRAVELLLQGTLRSKVCRYCLSVASPLSDLDQIMQIAGKGTLYKVSIRDMVACFHPFKTLNDPNFPRKICDKCLNRTISAYLFTQQCEQSERALRNCFEDMYAKLEKLDPLDKTKKRGRQKNNPNYNVLYSEHQKVMDYAEPMRNIVNIRSVSLSKETYMSELECPKCWQIFTKIEDMIVHEKSHPSNMWFNCRLCGKSFVKRLQLKRHLKQAHKSISPQIQPEEKQYFECGTCGFSSDEHSVHLQHIEKHKFQSVLQHLVEKKMDKLCTVCLDKKPKLVELDKMVRLHGGYSGVTGDKSLYSILGSTLPDRKSYKYQELYVPHHAKIMKLTQAKPQNDTLDNPGCNPSQIIMSNPLIISNDKIDFKEMYLFFFSDPSDDGKEIIPEDENIRSESIAHYIKDVERNDSVKSKELIEKQFENVETIFTISGNLNNQTIVKGGNEFNQSKYTPVNETLCKICWIFNKPTCKTCIFKESNSAEKASDDDKEAIDNTESQCKYCWIFKTEKCGICNSITNARVPTNINKDEDTEVCNGINTDLQRKRKLKGDEFTVQNKMWDCQICLTANIKARVTCICCESNRNNQDNMMKVNLDCKHPFKIFKTDDLSRKQEIVDLQIFKTSEMNESERQMSMVSTASIIPDVNTVNFEVMQYSSNEDTYKTFDVISTENKMIEDHEEMDIAEDVSQFIIMGNPNSFSFNTPNFSDLLGHLHDQERSSNMLSDSGFKFNIGAGSSKTSGPTGRRIMKPIRRMAYHK